MPGLSEGPAVGHAGCCRGAARPSTMSDYIDRGLRRRRAPALPIAGAACRDAEGRVARFSVRLVDGRVAEVAFEATACVTLVAYCEVAAEWVTGLRVDAAVGRVRVDALAAALPLVPPGRRDRARLAAAAWVAVAAAVERTRELPA
jgi:NifU-like protein involved in Fe-S cluster formation